MKLFIRNFIQYEISNFIKEEYPLSEISKFTGISTYKLKKWIDDNYFHIPGHKINGVWILEKYASIIILLLDKLRDRYGNKVDLGSLRLDKIRRIYETKYHAHDAIIDHKGYFIDLDQQIKFVNRQCKLSIYLNEMITQLSNPDDNPKNIKLFINSFDIQETFSKLFRGKPKIQDDALIRAYEEKSNRIQENLPNNWVNFYFAVLHEFGLGSTYGKCYNKELDIIETERQKINEDFSKNNTFYIYKNNLYQFDASDIYTQEEQQLLIKEHYFKQEKKFQRLKKEIKLFEKLESSEKLKREPIPEDVRFAVWRRDGGKCVKCGIKEKLEFDHIIPLSKGGSNTERNIQLLCEKCNREKSDKI